MTYIREKQDKQVSDIGWKSSFNNLIGMNEAGEIWGKSPITLRHNIKWGKFVEGIDVKKFGNQWIFRKEALIREYGQPEKKQ